MINILVQRTSNIQATRTSANSCSLLRKLDSENEMLEAPAVHLVTCLDGVLAVGKTDEGKALGETCIPVFGEEHPGDATEMLEHFAKLLLLCHFRDLWGSRQLANITFLSFPLDFRLAASLLPTSAPNRKTRKK